MTDEECDRIIADWSRSGTHTLRDLAHMVSNAAERDAGACANATPSLALTSEVLTVLGAGLARLDDSDPKDRALAAAAELQLFQATRLVYDGRGLFELADRVTHGYVESNGAGVCAWQAADGAWTTGSIDVPDGTRLYFDAACTMYLRTVEQG